MKLKSLILALTVLCFVFALTSCAVEIGISSVSLEIGQCYDLSSDISGNFAVSSSSDVVSVIGGTVIRGERKGEATLTITKGLNRSEIEVIVDYAPIELSVSCSNPYVTQRGAILSFVASVGANADRSQDISWYLDGKKAGMGSTFDFSVPDYGIYEVTAECQGQKVTERAVCFVPFKTEPIAEVSGETFEVGDEVKLNAKCEQNTVVKWFIDEEPAGYGAEIRYKAESSGDHTAFALVNGVETNRVNFSVLGAPHNVVCDFDSSYPDAFLRWEGATTEYEVTVGDMTYDGSSPRMGAFYFDLSGLIDLAQQTELSVRAVGHGETVRIFSPKLNKIDLNFLGQKYLNGNYFMTSDDEVFDIVNYAMIFRPTGNKIELELQMGYTSELTPGLLLSEAWTRTEQTGIYRLSAKGSSRCGEKLILEIDCMTGNEPNNFDTSNKAVYESLSTPLFCGSVNALPIDDLPKCEVASSEQLLYVVNNGFCPVPTTQSVSDLYERARNILCRIVNDEMNEEQKVRAIFEWIMWNINYDYVASNETDIYKSVTEPAYYLEGVFVSRFAVCDGIAKAMSLMCNMLDIPCVRVVGTVVQSGRTMRHAWNKVRLNGRWYLVDATWSDALTSIGNKTFEGGLHNYYLLSDAEAIDHTAAYDQHKAHISYDYYGKNNLSLLIADFEAINETIQNARQSAVFEVKIGDEVIKRDFYCIELKIEKSVENFCKINYSRFLELINSLEGYKAHCFTGGMLLITIAEDLP